MAVDYLHRLVVCGPDSCVRHFTDAARRRARYRIPGEQSELTEVIPLSFEALWRRHSRLRDFAIEPPSDPYHLRAWPRRSIRSRLSFARYQFQTRRMEMQEIVRLLSVSNRDLVFALVTLCLDASEVRTRFFRHGRVSEFTVPESRMEELTLAETARLQADGEADDIEGTARENAEVVAMEEALHRWDGQLAKLVSNRPNAKTARRSTRKASGAFAKLLAGFAGKTLEWFDRRQKRDRLSELNLILLDDSRRDPQLRELLGLEPPGGKPRPASREAEDWPSDSRRCRLRRWEALRGDLSHLLHRMTKEHQRCLIVAIPYRFVQFRTWEDGTIRGEAVSNRFLIGDKRLDRRVQLKLVSLGWNRPTKLQPTTGRHGTTPTRQPASPSKR
jgi:hypothetical protein